MTMGQSGRFLFTRLTKRFPVQCHPTYIACIDQQNDSVYWIGTIGGGVNKLTIHLPQNNDYSATCYTNNDG